MLLEILFSAAAVYGGAAAYKAGKRVFGGSKSYSLEGNDGKYHLNGKSYKTLDEYSEAVWREGQRQKLKHIDFMREIGVTTGSIGRDEEELRANVKEWDEKGI